MTTLRVRFILKFAVKNCFTLLTKVKTSVIIICVADSYVPLAQLDRATAF